MSDNSNFGFARLVPGFDFLQNLAKGAAPSLPQQLSSWIAPTLNVEELEKRISELKAVQFWLDQNGKALGATIQALEVQKMTLATLRGMNVRMGEVADALKLKPQAAAKAAPAPEPQEDAAEPPAAAKAGKGGKAAGKAGAPVDPMQWWGALTHQFQQIAADAMKDAAQRSVVEPPAGTGSRSAAAKERASAAKRPKAAKKAAPRKAAPRKRAGQA